MNTKKQLITANVLIAITLMGFVALGALLSSGCHEIGDEPTAFEVEDIEDDGPQKYWVILESATIPAWKVETADYLPDPWATIYRLGDRMGQTASCDMETYNPVWEDHVLAGTVTELTDDIWSIVLYDYELEPTGENYLGDCKLDVTAFQIEHEMTVHLDRCDGAVETVVIRFERYTGEVDTDLEKNPNC